MPSKVFKVFICSTFSDLQEECQRVIFAIQRLRLQHDSMEFFGARPNRPIETCLQEVRSSDIFVGIVGHRYGSIVPNEDVSYSEMEYDEATRIGIPRLIYIKDRSIPVLPEHFETHPNGLRLLDAFKKKLNERHTVMYFKSAEELAVQIAADLSQVLESLRYPPEDIDQSLASLRNRVVDSLDDAVRASGNPERLLSAVVHLITTFERPAPKVFLSHSWKDKEFARKLARDLTKNGVEVWFDEWELKIGDSLSRKIQEGISTSGFLAVILSPESVASKWVSVELNAALNLELERQAVRVLPVLYKDCSMPPFLRDKMYADFRRDYARGLEAILRTLHSGRASDEDAQQAAPPDKE
jgi:hypothetical protein